MLKYSFTLFYYLLIAILSDQKVKLLVLKTKKIKKNTIYDNEN